MGTPREKSKSVSSEISKGMLGRQGGHARSQAEAVVVGDDRRREGGEGGEGEGLHHRAVLGVHKVEEGVSAGGQRRCRSRSRSRGFEGQKIMIARRGKATT